MVHSTLFLSALQFYNNICARNQLSKICQQMVE